MVINQVVSWEGNTGALFASRSFDRTPTQVTIITRSQKSISAYARTIPIRYRIHVVSLILY